jgi:hypothetical protein
VSAHDVVFYALSLAAVGAALVAGRTAGLSKACKAGLIEGAALAGLLGLASAPAAAALTGSCVVLGYAAMKRSERGTAAGVEPATFASRDAPLDDAATLASRLRTAALVTAFFVIAARSVLIVSWPFAHAAPRAAAAIPSAALANFLVVSLLLVSIGFFSAISRRTVAGVGLGLLGASGGVALALASASRFVASGGEAAPLAALVVVIAAGATAITVRAAGGGGDLARSSDTAWNVAGSLSAVLAGVTLALLATAW